MERMNLITHPTAAFSEERIYYFKKEFFIDKPIKFAADVFADSRYKLYLNGNLIGIGPCKGNASDMYYDHIETKACLNNGKNILEAVVLQLKNEYDGNTVYANLCSVLRTGNIRFALKGEIESQNGAVIIETDESWLTAKADGISFARDNDNTVGLNERINNTYFASLKWTEAKCADVCVNYEAEKDIHSQRGRYSLKPAPIPNQALIPIELSFNDSVCDAGEYVTAYLKYVFSGKGQVKLTYAECKTLPGETKKADRTDENGLIEGYCDIVCVDGDNVEYSPFWFRAFRFIKAEITGDVKIKSIEGIKTHYPLKCQGSFECDIDAFNKLWEISLRTLKCCMHETYEDCPYYEQEQYLMDSRLEILYGYQVSNDDKMVRRLLRDFASNQQADGMLRSRTPDILPQIIPAYSLYYIFILYEHFERFADISLIKAYLPTALGALRYFSEHLSEKGLVKRSAFWDFVDWAADWKKTGGVPLGEDDEELTVYTLMYAAALKKAAELMQILGDKDGAKLLLNEAEARIYDVKKHCFDEEKMLFADGPSKKYFSVHAQIWAVLSDSVNKETEKIIMKNSFALSTKPTYCYIYDYFRALEKCGLYHERKKMLEELLRLVKLNCTTVPEKPVNPRSECHAWNAVALYEYTASDLGIRINEANRTIIVKPYIQDLNFANGVVPLKEKEIKVSWKKENKDFIIEITSPKEYIKQITLPSGNAYEKTDEKIVIREEI